MDFCKIGKEIKDLRKSIGMSQAELSEGICTQAQISKIEKGEVYPLAPTLYLIAQRLGVDINYFFDIATTPKLDYINEVNFQFLQARRNLQYEEIFRIVQAEKKNPMFQKVQKNKQILLWHEGICAFHINKDKEKALHLLDKAVRLTQTTDKVLNEREIEIYNSIGVIYFENEDYQKAIETYKIALSYLPRFPYIHDDTIKTRLCYNYAKALTRLELYKDAIKWCEEAINWCIARDNMYLFAELHYHIGYIHLLLQNKNEASLFMENALKIFELQHDTKYITYLKEKINEIT